MSYRLYPIMRFLVTFGSEMISKMIKDALKVFNDFKNKHQKCMK